MGWPAAGLAKQPELLALETLAGFPLPVPGCYRGELLLISKETS